MTSFMDFMSVAYELQLMLAMLQGCRGLYQTADRLMGSSEKRTPWPELKRANKDVITQIVLPHLPGICLIVFWGLPPTNSSHESDPIKNLFKICEWSCGFNCPHVK